MLHKAWNSKWEMPYCFPRSSIKFQGHTVQNITDFDPNWAFPDYRPVAAFKSLRFALLSFNIYLFCGRICFALICLKASYCAVWLLLLQTLFWFLHLVDKCIRIKVHGMSNWMSNWTGRVSVYGLFTHVFSMYNHEFSNISSTLWVSYMVFLWCVIWSVKMNKNIQLIKYSMQYECQFCQQK